MISFTGSLKILLLVDCCDMREASTVFYGLMIRRFGEILEADCPTSSAIGAIPESRCTIFYGTALSA
jgi:hypothetical protein